MNHDTIFTLTTEDFEMVLERKLTEEEIQLCKDKFTIEDWVEIVGIFLDCRGIKK